MKKARFVKKKPGQKVVGTARFVKTRGKKKKSGGYGVYV